MDNVPAYLTNAPASNFADDAVHGLGGVRPPSLSIAKQNFTAIDAGGNERPVANFDQIQGSPTFGRLFVDVVLIDANKNVSKTYYAGQYDASAAEFSPPDCWSDNGVAPSSAADHPQSPTCAACPHNQWGSKISQTGGQTKACRDAKKVALLIPATGSDMPFLLRIPPASLNKQWAPYIRMLAQQNLGNRRMTPSDVVTRITFDAATQGVLNFSPVGFISQEQLAQVQRAQAADLTAQIVGKNDQPHQGALPAPAAPQLAAQAPILQQAPVQQFQTAPQNSGYVAPAPTSGQPPGLQQMQQQQPQSFGGGAGTSFAVPQQMPVGQTPQFAAQQFAPSAVAQMGQNLTVPPAAQAFAQPVQQPATLAGTDIPVRRTRRGRTNPPAEQAPVQPQQVQQPVQQAPVQQFAQPPAAPAFMMGNQQAQPVQAQPVQQQGVPSHGMVSAPPPTAELAATLANAFGPQGGN